MTSNKPIASKCLIVGQSAPSEKWLSRIEGKCEVLAIKNPFQNEKKLFWSRAEISLTDNNRSKRPKNPQKYHDRHFGLIQLWLTQIIWPRMTFTWPENMWSYWPATLSGTFYIWKRFGITESRSCILKVSFEMDLMFKWN